MRTFHRYSAVFLVPLFFGGAAAVETLDPPVEKANVSIQTPKGWSVTTRVQPPALLSAVAPHRDKDETGEFQASLLLSIEPGGKVDGQAQQSRVSKEFSDYQGAEAPVPVTVNGLQGTTFGGTFTAGGSSAQGKVKLRFRQYIFGQENRLYVITFTCLESQWAAYQPRLESCVGTFKLKK